MTAPEPMGPARRRAIPGMTRPNRPAPAAVEPSAHKASERSPADASAQRPHRSWAAPADGVARRAASDYAATRLANFRLPVDLHDRYRDLVRDAERRHPRLRRASLTELIIALLEEGPGTADGVAELIWRKRAAEHEGQL